MQLTEQQKRAVESRKKNIIVSAGAGSGKTRVMIERICSLVSEGADLRRMAVCTFTKTAAADMKRKLAERLAESPDPKLRNQATKLSGVEISTLHSWCSHIIKRWFFDGDVDPDFTIMEEGEEATLKGDFAERVIEEAKESNDPDFLRLYAAFAANHSHRRLKAAVLQAYDYARAQADPAGWLNKSAQFTDDEYRNKLYDALNKEAKEKLLPQIRQLLSDVEAAQFTKEIPFVAQLRDCVEMEIACTASVPVLRGKPEFSELHERVKEIKGKYADLCRRREEIKAMPSHESSLPLCAALAGLALKLDGLYADYKRGRGKVDYSDLEHETLAILRGEHGGEIASSYDYVFVDEYQDISPLQEEILKCFDKTCNMFFVGDLKQSIYGFRMCSPRFFGDKFRVYASGQNPDCEALELNANFRSGGEVLRAVNEVFSSAMTDRFGGIEYSALAVGRELAAEVRATYIKPSGVKPEPPSGVYSVIRDEGAGADKDLDCQTEMVLEQILKLLDDKTVSPSDIAVLVRSRGAFTDLLERKLRAALVPVCVLSSDNRADSFASVSALVAMLRVLNNSCDDVNLAAVMLSPLFGAFSADELAAARAGKDGTFYDCVFSRSCADGCGAGAAELKKSVTLLRSGGLGLEEKLGSFASVVARLRESADALTVAELAGTVTAAFDCFNGALSAGGEREAAALDCYLEHLAAQSEYDTLGKYIAHTDKVGMPSLAVREGSDAVRIMTIHASKGLEFPYVILPVLHKRFNLRDVYAGVICDRDEGVVLRSVDFERRVIEENPRYAVCSASLRRALVEEELRLLYVAMTRAEKKLIMYSAVPGAERANDDSVAYIDWLRPLFDGTATTIDCDGYEPEYAVVPPLCMREPVGETVRRLCERFDEKYPHAAGAVKASVSGVIHEEDPPYIPVDMFAKGQNAPASDDRAAQAGSAYHKFMQSVDFSRDSSAEWDGLREKFPDEAKLVDRDAIVRAFDNMREFIAGREFYREKAFVLGVPAAQAGAEGDDEVLVQGVIDLLVLNPDRTAVIVDYKTGDCKRIESNETYVRQLGWYARAVHSALAMEVKDALLYAFTPGKFISKADKIGQD